MSKLLECRCCPFCGSLEVNICRTSETACWVQCAACGSEGESHSTRKRAIEKWNRRVDLAARAVIIDDGDKDYRHE